MPAQARRDPPRAIPRGHLDELRRAYGMRWAELAAVSRVTVKRLRQIDTGRIDRLQVGTLMRVALALGVKCSDVMPLLAAQPSRDCAASRWVSNRAELVAEAKRRCLAPPTPAAERLSERAAELQRRPRRTRIVARDFVRELAASGEGHVSPAPCNANAPAEGAGALVASGADWLAAEPAKPVNQAREQHE